VRNSGSPPNRGTIPVSDMRAPQAGHAAISIFGLLVFQSVIGHVRIKGRDPN